MKATYRTALVTGASGGIGEIFARQLAARRCDLVLVARRAEPMEKLAATLAEWHGVDVEVITADLTVAADLARVAERLSDPDRPIELLVNNAGAGSRPPRPFHQQDPAGEETKVALNVIAPMRLTRAALPGMVARNHGGVLTVSSIAAYWPQPHGATYAATKAFLSSFGDTLACELAGTDVHVTTVVPGFTKRGNGVAKGGPKSFTLPDFAWLEREDVAAQGLAAVHAGVPICIPGATYKAALGLTRVLPRSVLRELFRRIWGS